MNMIGYHKNKQVAKYAILTGKVAILHKLAMEYLPLIKRYGEVKTYICLHT